MPKNFVFHSKKVKEDKGIEYTWCSSIKYWEENPLLIPLLIASYVDYRSITKLMNVSWASIFAS